ncbi:hypothetical protein CLU79DRAFT_708472 [Phycomyces nitens]|nr:hypothetical protein CLU79DRAFT_708472 [Phycomyces nitens]
MNTPSYESNEYRYPPPGAPRSFSSAPGSPRIYSTPPPPYEKVGPPSSRLTKISDYVWKRASFSSGIGSGGSIAASPSPLKPAFIEEVTIDKKQTDHGVTLINVATEMDQAGNHQMATDLYLMGLERMLCALPIESDPRLKIALERKLVEFKETKGLDLESIVEATEEDEKDVPADEPYGFSGLVINAAILGAVALKRSPLPDVLSSAVSYAKSGFQSVDEAYHIRQRAWDFATQGVAKAVEIDQQYEVHRMLTDALYTGCTAILKAGIAYTEAPGYKEHRRMSAP